MLVVSGEQIKEQEMNMLKTNPLFVLINMVFKYKKIDPRKITNLFIFSVRTLFSLPFYFIQSILYSKKIQRISINKPPIFILGHFRSGTTMLHKLLTSDNRFGYVTNYDILCPHSNLLFGKYARKLMQPIINRFGIKNYHYNNTILKLDDPAEEDMYLVSKGSPFSAYWGFAFPLFWNELLCNSTNDDNSSVAWREAYLGLLKQITFQNEGKQLVLKNPPNTGRVAQLLKIFPNAKFIYIHRNPFALYYSMKNLWKRAIKKYYSLQPLSMFEMEEIIFSYYQNLLEQYEIDKKLIPVENLIEIEYEQLEADPFTVIKEIYLQLSLPDFGFAKGTLNERIAMESAYKKFNFNFRNAVFEKIEKRWKTIIKERNYKKPEIIN